MPENLNELFFKLVVANEETVQNTKNLATHTESLANEVEEQKALFNQLLKVQNRLVNALYVTTAVIVFRALVEVILPLIR